MSVSEIQVIESPLLHITWLKEKLKIGINGQYELIRSAIISDGLDPVFVA